MGFLFMEKYGGFTYNIIYYIILYYINHVNLLELLMNKINI